MATETPYQMPRRDPGVIRNMFNAISWRYDLLNFLMSFGLDSRWRKVLVKESGVKQGDVILDLACGTGDQVFSFLKAQKDLRITGVDFSPQMIEIATVKARKRKEGKAIFQIGDALHLEAEDNSVDLISMDFALRNLADLPAAFAEMSRVLKPGGKALCLELTRPKNIFLKLGHFLFLKTYIPVMGFLFSGDYKAYAYLARSIREFPPADMILEEMQSNGFSVVYAKKLAGGIATIFVGEVAKEQLS